MKRLPLNIDELVGLFANEKSCYEFRMIMFCHNNFCKQSIEEIV